VPKPLVDGQKCLETSRSTRHTSGRVPALLRVERDRTAVAAKADVLAVRDVIERASRASELVQKRYIRMRQPLPVRYGVYTYG
jgi:hypothetical protein